MDAIERSCYISLLLVSSVLQVVCPTFSLYLNIMNFRSLVCWSVLRRLLDELDKTALNLKVASYTFLYAAIIHCFVTSANHHNNTSKHNV